MEVLEKENGGVFFGLDDSFDLYRKSLHDLERCQTALDSQEKMYALFDLAIGLDALQHWVGDETKGTEAEEYRKWFLFSKGTTQRVSCYGELQAMANYVSIGVKHMHKASSSEMRKIGMAFGAGAIDSVAGNYYFQSRLNNSAVFSMFIVDGKNFEPICAELVKHWGEFFREILGKTLV